MTRTTPRRIPTPAHPPTASRPTPHRGAAIYRRHSPVHCAVGKARLDALLGGSCPNPRLRPGPAPDAPERADSGVLEVDVPLHRAFALGGASAVAAGGSRAARGCELLQDLPRHPHAQPRV